MVPTRSLHTISAGRDIKAWSTRGAGLAFSTVVSLLVVPALYACFDNLAGWSRKLMRTTLDVSEPAAAVAPSGVDA
jgi:hypothetical protein